MVFDGYADYYDLFYEDKDYIGEAKYIDSLIKKYHLKAKSILDLGCGTGKHAFLLSKMNYEKVHGIDMSSKMLEKAYMRSEKQKNLSFSQGNIQELELNEKYDVITALFHVMSYQITDEALEMVIDQVKKHLKKDGILIFDCWYGPAVLSQGPEFRIKRLENEMIKGIRIAEPILKENENIVEVNYDIFIKNKLNHMIVELNEKHRMRYFFLNEIKKFLKKNSMQVIDFFEFMTNLQPGKKTWSVCFVGKI